MKWLIVEDALRDRKGHWLEYVTTFVQELQALGGKAETENCIARWQNCRKIANYCGNGQ